MCTIREMNDQDVYEVEQVAIDAWHATYEGIIPREVQDQFLATAYNVERLKIRHIRSPFYVAIKDEKIIGYANFSNRKENGHVELGAIYLLPEAQGKGVGSKLLARGIEDLKPNAIELSVERDNEIGKTFYLSKGFIVIEEFEEDFAGNMLQTLRMKLELK